jgi:hypothetical protein
MAEDGHEERPDRETDAHLSEEPTSAVGYRRPPRETQFKPGQSGNPKGRRTGARNVKTEIAEILSQPIKVREGNKVRRTTKFGAMTLAHVQNGMKGDVRSFNAVASVMARTGLLNASDLDEGKKPQTAEDEAIVHDFLARQKGDDPE